MSKQILKDIVSYIDFLRSQGFLVTLSRFDPLFSVHLPTLLKYEVHLSPICSYLKSNSKTLGCCVENKRKLEKKQIDKPYYSCCYAGVEEFVVPIINDNHVICCVNVSGYRSNLDKSSKFYESLKSILPTRFVELYQELDDTPPELSTVINMTKPLEYMFISLYLECVTQSAQSDSSNLYQKALRYIYDNYMNSFTLEDMAKDLNYSPSYLRHTFKQKSGKNIGEALNSVRLFQAKQLLLTTNLSITYIGTECGFCDGNYFSTVFKKKYGITPKQYRLQH